jgi:hypothetical protein
VRYQFEDICDADNQGTAANKKQNLRKIDKTHRCSSDKLYGGLPTGGGKPNRKAQS